MGEWRILKRQRRLRVAYSSKLEIEIRPRDTNVLKMQIRDLGGIGVKKFSLERL